MKGMIFIQQFQCLMMVAIMMVGLCFVPSVHAGVGMLGGEESLYNSDLSFKGGNAFWDGSRNKIDSICKRRNATLIQGYEYGYSYFHTVFANVAFAYRQCGQINVRARRNAAAFTVVSGQDSGIGDVQLGVRTRLNHSNTAAWEASLIIPTGYNNLSGSALGRGALGLALGLRFASDGNRYRRNSWGWKLGSTYTYFFASKGNSLATFAAINYAFTESNFEQTGDFASLKINYSIGFANNGVQRTLFFNQLPRSLTNSDTLSLSLAYSHAFKNGWSTNARIGKGLFGRSAPVDYTAGWGVSYRWKD